MGGRGGSSASRNIKHSQSKSAKLSVKQLESKVEQYAKFAPPGKSHDAKKAAQYYSYRTQLMNARAEQVARISKVTVQSKSTKTFVNSYGEATKRNISNATYENAKKRNSKAVLRNMGY